MVVLLSANLPTQAADRLLIVTGHCFTGPEAVAAGIAAEAAPLDGVVAGHRARPALVTKSREVIGAHKRIRPPSTACSPAPPDPTCRSRSAPLVLVEVSRAGQACAVARVELFAARPDVEAAPPSSFARYIAESAAATSQVGLVAPLGCDGDADGDADLAVAPLTRYGDHGGDQPLGHDHEQFLQVVDTTPTVATEACTVVSVSRTTEWMRSATSVSTASPTWCP